MAFTQLLLNDQLVTITADPNTIRNLNEDDRYLADYVNRAAKVGQFNFLFAREPALRRIVVKRVPIVFKQVWYKKGRPSENDTAANVLLLKLRNSDKYALRFKDGHSLKHLLWEEVANEMRLAGFDVDAQRCAQKFNQLVQKKGDCFGGESEEDDEEWVPKGKRRKKGEDDDFLKKFLKKSGEQKDERFKEVCGLIRKRNELLEEKLKQNEEIIKILGKFVEN